MQYEVLRGLSKHDAGHRKRKEFWQAKWTVFTSIANTTGDHIRRPYTSRRAAREVAHPAFSVHDLKSLVILTPSLRFRSYEMNAKRSFKKSSKGLYDLVRYSLRVLAFLCSAPPDSREFSSTFIPNILSYPLNLYLPFYFKLPSEVVFVIVVVFVVVCL